nr:MAG TPA: hypothetical protein [Caudoviricetes sp.]
MNSLKIKNFGNEQPKNQGGINGKRKNFECR